MYLHGGRHLLRQVELKNKLLIDSIKQLQQSDAEIYMYTVKLHAQGVTALCGQKRCL